MINDQLKAFSKPGAEKMENMLKFGRYTRTDGSDGELQGVQIENIRNLDECLKMTQFGFNSKAPIGSRAIVSRIGNEKIIIANEHVTSIIDITSGNTIIYNESGHFIKIEDDTITTSAPNVITDCENFTVNTSNFTVNASSKTSFNTPTADFSANVNVSSLLSAGNYSGLLGSGMTTNVTLTTTQDVIASGISLSGHKHGGVQPGGSNTDIPF